MVAFLNLRINGTDLEAHEIIILQNKNNKDHVTMLPHYLCSEVKDQISTIQMVFDIDRALQRAEFYLLFTLAQKYPNADKMFAWF